jgi:hypothetical protein
MRALLARILAALRAAFADHEMSDERWMNGDPEHFPDVGKMVRRKANHAHTYELSGRSKTHVHLRPTTRIVLPLATFEADYEIAPDRAR